MTVVTCLSYSFSKYDFIYSHSVKLKSLGLEAGQRPFGKVSWVILTHIHRGETAPSECDSFHSPGRGVSWPGHSFRMSFPLRCTCASWLSPIKWEWPQTWAIVRRLKWGKTCILSTAIRFLLIHLCSLSQEGRHFQNLSGETVYSYLEFNT